jgi:hypothetical protein
MRAVRAGLLGFAILFALSGAGCSCTETGLRFGVHGPEAGKVGQTAQFSGYVNDTVNSAQDGAQPKARTLESGVAWSVLDGPSGGATIDSAGRFKATAPGTYSVQGKYGAQTAVTKIVVEGAVPEVSEDTSGTQFMEAAPEQADPATLEEIILSGNGMAVVNGGRPFTFTISKARRVREIWSYHWNNEKGKAGGTITIKGSSGAAQFRANRTAPGQGGVPNAYWVADTDFVIQPGTYTFIDSDPSTWSTNGDNGGKGMGWIKVTKQ